MPAIKFLVSGESNSGKTTLTNTLEDVLVFSHDGKNYPFPKPHVNIPTFGSAAELIKMSNEKLDSYNEKYKTYPKSIVYDSVSKIFDTMLDNCNRKHQGFKVYSELNNEIHEFTDYIQNVLIEGGINVILVSHAIYDAETSKYSLVGKGDFQKRGGFLAEVDHSAFIETKNNKRIVHNRSTKYPARTTLAELPDSVSMEDYNLQEHINMLTALQDEVSDYVL